ncbi:hypothetical protein MATL_G00157430 [Megalops atlanticus]|uniref:Ras and Rab interactor 3 n=1 Tax=Megalops atlanticus TaxID=7932 RepID=A0A9D3PS97_MEGAT|nr:hypothetical protein MATL_G00157430 [Megalops atlanticus]
MQPTPAFGSTPSIHLVPDLSSPSESPSSSPSVTVTSSPVTDPSSFAFSEPSSLSSSPPLDAAPSMAPCPRASPHLSISIMERLIRTCPVWLQLGMSQEKASLILQGESPGIFLVRKNISRKRMILSVRLSDQEGAPHVQDILIKEEKSLIYLEGSILVFDNIFKLIAFYCLSRDILPFTLRLPQVIVQATKYEDMDIIASLGSNFWGSSLNSRPEGEPAHEIDPSVRDSRLWYVSLISIEEHCDGLALAVPMSRSQSLTTPGQAHPPSRPLRPHPWEISPAAPRQTGDGPGESPARPPPPVPPPPRRQKEEGSGRCRESRQWRGADSVGEAELSLWSSERGTDTRLTRQSLPPLGVSERNPEEPSEMHGATVKKATRPASAAVCTETAAPAGKHGDAPAALKTKALAKGLPPVPPPRRKRMSQLNSTSAPLEPGQHGGTDPPLSSSPMPGRRPTSSGDRTGSNTSLHTPDGGATPLCQDSYSNSSTEEEADPSGAAMSTAMRRSPTVILDRAKQRLSMVSLSQVFNRFMKADRKLHRRIVELARDRDSYFGNLVRDYQAFTLETMKKHSSSTEMLQEIRQMLTQLKSYLIQSRELQGLPEAALYPEDKLEAVIEVALYKGVLKPLREAVYAGLRDIHTRDDTLTKLKENQQVVLNTTTTDLGVTTSVPEAPVMEKIQLRLDLLHREYSPEEKISHLLKTCKMIYESMSVGCPGKPHGADNFLPVLMYVLARSNITALLLDVEYMMELMDPALQLGEGSYYLTTTYGALEHIKNYDKQAVTRHLSLEVQDSIHRWERRRTHNKARLSRSSVQDFINVSFLEAGADAKTLCVCTSTTTQELRAQCASKFEVEEPESYGLWVSVEGQDRLLAADEYPLTIKADLHYSEPRKEFCFIYRRGSWRQEADAPNPPQPGTD